MSWIKIKQFFCHHDNFHTTRVIFQEAREVKCVRCGKEFSAYKIGGEFFALTPEFKEFNDEVLKLTKENGTK